MQLYCVGGNDVDAVFYITFYRTTGSNTGLLHRHAFYVDHLTQPWNTIEECLAAHAEELDEQYGEPDWSSSHTPNSFGCICFNVETQMHEELLNIWQHVFLKTWPQCVVGPVCVVDGHARITNMLQITKDAHEHQQAQLLRNTLNAHVSNGLVAQSKKM